MKTPVLKTFNDLLGTLGNTNPAIAVEVGTDFERVKKWRRKNRVPSDHWPAVLAAARRKGHDLTADDLLRMQEASRPAR